MRFFFFLILIVNFSCVAQGNKAIRGVNTIIGSIDERDKECLAGIAKAEKDFKTNEIYFYIDTDADLMVGATKHFPFFAELLKEKGISFGRGYSTTVLAANDDGSTYVLKIACYEETCNKLLDLKYGNGFIKKLEKKADSLYVMNRINDVFTYSNGTDCYLDYNCLVYPNVKDYREQNTQIKQDFSKGFKFPKRFIYNHVQREFYAHCNFIINRDSSVSKININIEFNNPKNAKFSKYITEEVMKFIKSINWKPATSAGINVNTYFEIVF